MSDKLATKDPEKESWKFQLSWKLGQHMLNVRGADYAEFQQALKDITENPEQIILALGTFEMAPTEQHVPLQQTLPQPPAPAPAKANGPEAEVGPVVVTSVNEKGGVSGPQSKTPGKPYTKYEVVFGNGALKAGTFDSLIASVARNLIGKSAYARVENKGKWGYDLLNVRPA